MVNINYPCSCSIVCVRFAGTHAALLAHDCKDMSLPIAKPNPIAAIRSVMLLALLTVGGSLSSAHAADARYYGIIKSQRCQQAVGAAPTALATNAFAFNAFVFASTNLAVTNATVKAPSPSVTPARTLVSGLTGGDWQFDEQFNTQNALDTAYPTATLSSYTFTICATNDGVRTCTANFFLAGTPPTPQISNLVAAQQIDTTTNFALTWNSLNGTSFDIVQVLITGGANNLVFASPVFFSSNALNGASTSLVIPACALPAGRQLTGHLTIAKPGVPNTSSYPGATGIGALACDTEFPLATLPPASPRLHVLSSRATPFVVGFTGESNRNYLLQGSANLSNWLAVQLTNSPTGSGVITDHLSNVFTQRFYRIQVVP